MAQNSPRPYGVLGRVLGHSYTPVIYRELAGLDSVSYTHLDVYKRQVLLMPHQVPEEHQARRAGGRDSEGPSDDALG